MALTATAIAVGVALSAWWADKATTSLGHSRGISASTWFSRRLSERVLPNSRLETTESDNVETRLHADLSPAASDELGTSWGGSDCAVRKDRVPNYVRHIAGELKLRYPYAALTNSTADLLSVQAAIRECFRRDNLRMCDQIKYMGMIVTMMFTPSAEEIQTHEDLQSLARAKLVQRYTAGTRDHWMDTLLGTERRFHFARQ